MSTTTTLSEFEDESAEDGQWPVRSGDHSVVKTTPTRFEYGSVDDDLALRCLHCGTILRIPEDRAIPDHEYAQNVFSTRVCSTTDGQTA